jgi:hypothetical protein
MTESEAIVKLMKECDDAAKNGIAHAALVCDPLPMRRVMICLADEPKAKTPSGNWSIFWFCMGIVITVILDWVWMR